MKDKAITIEELRKMTLPVKLVCFDGYYAENFKSIEVVYIGTKYLFIIDSYRNEILFCMSDLKHYKIAPKTKIIEVNDTYYANSHGVLSLFMNTKHKYPIHINQTLEVCEETGKVLSVEVRKWKWINY